MKRIFLTGGTGFLGSHFIRHAIELGHEVFALRRPGSHTQIPLSIQPHWLDGQLTSDWTDEFKKCDAFVHLAATGVSPQIPSWQELFQVNVLESLMIWRAAAQAGVRRFIICGSCFEYGSSGTRYEFIPPDAPLLPTTAYGASKAAASVAALGLAAESNLSMLVLRPFHIFGEGENSARLWPSLKLAASSGCDFPMTLGEQIRDFLPVEAAAATILASLDRPDLLPGIPLVENLGSGQPMSLLDFASYWWKKWQAPGQLLAGKIPYRPSEVMRYVAEIPPSTQKINILR